MILQNRYIQPTYRVITPVLIFYLQQIPDTIQIHSEGTFFYWRIRLTSNLRHIESLMDRCKEFFHRQAI